MSAIAGRLQRDHRELELGREVIGGTVQHPHSGGGCGSGGSTPGGETSPHYSMEPVVRWAKFGRSRLRDGGQLIQVCPNHR